MVLHRIANPDPSGCPGSIPGVSVIGLRPWERKRCEFKMLIIKPHKEEELKRFFEYQAFRGMMRDQTLSAYEDILDINLEHLVKSKICEQKQFTWYDMCCGDFIAGKDLLVKLERKNKNLLSKVLVRGIDVYVDKKNDSEEIILEGNAVLYPLPLNVDLITCNLGIWYIEQYHAKGKMIEAIEHWHNHLSPNGMIAFDIHDDEAIKYNFTNPLTEHLDKRFGNLFTKRTKTSQTRVDYSYTHDLIKIRKSKFTNSKSSQHSL